jgi:hypothetical protein
LLINIDVESLYDNRDTTLITRYTPGESDFFSELHGYKFPVDYKNPSNYWLKLYSFIPLIFQQLLSPGGPELQFRTNAEEFGAFIKEAGFNDIEALNPRLLELFLRHVEGVNVVKDIQAMFLEFQHHWKHFEGQLEQKTILLDSEIFVQMTALIEAINSACIFAASEKDRDWKLFLIKLLKQMKKCLSKAAQTCTSESVLNLRNRTISNSPLLSVKNINLDGIPCNGICAKWLVCKFN